MKAGFMLLSIFNLHAMNSLDAFKREYSLHSLNPETANELLVNAINEARHACSITEAAYYKQVIKVNKGLPDGQRKSFDTLFPELLDRK